MELSNISSVTVREGKGGGEYERWFVLENRSFSIQFNRGALSCVLRDARIEYELREFHGEPQDADRYIIFTDFSSMDGNAQLVHNDREPYDIWTSWGVTATMDNETLFLSKGEFIIPDDEVADVHIQGHGSIGFDVMPTFQVDGHIAIEEFTAVTRQGLEYRKYEDLLVEGSEITMRTRKKPDYWEDHGVHIVPWTVSISTKPGSSADISSDLHYGHISIFSFLIIIVLVYLRVIVMRHREPRQ
jgi:hypothetical protein